MLERPLCENMGACLIPPSTVLPSNVGSEYEFGAAMNVIVELYLQCMFPWLLAAIFLMSYHSMAKSSFVKTIFNVRLR